MTERVPGPAPAEDARPGAVLGAVEGDEWLTVGAVAEACGISVRTLHHWDSIGLAEPSGRSQAGYRLYDAADIGRIQRILVFRELELPLADIATLLDDAEANIHEQLVLQRDQLRLRISRLQEIVSAVDTMLENTDMNRELNAKEQAEVFGKEWAAETEERWGGTPQWAESKAREAQMAPEDWERIKREGDRLNAELGAAVRDDLQSGSPEANALVERHRAMISDFYECSHSMQVLLGRMYIQDSRFTATYEGIQPGLAAWLTSAIDANARIHGVDPDTAQWQ